MDLILTGATIAKLRKEAGLTQASLAHKLGISDKAVSKWERGISLPDAAYWSRLSMLLDTDIESLIYGHSQAEEWIGVYIADPAIDPGTMIYNKQMTDYILSQFLLAGIKEIVITGAAGDIEIPGVRITFLKELNQQFTKHAFVIYGNQFLYGPNVTKHFKRAMSILDSVTVPGLLMQKGRYPVVVNSDRHGAFGESAGINKYFGLPYAFVPAGMKIAKNLTDYKSFHVETLERGMIHFDLKDHEEVLEMAQFVRMMEKRTGERIGDPREIALRRSLADKDEIKKDDYIRKLFG